MPTTMTRRTAGYQATSLVEVAYLLASAIEEGQRLMADPSARCHGRTPAREWELTGWFKRVAFLFDGLCHLLGDLDGRSAAGMHGQALADELQAAVAAMLNDEGQTLEHWGLRRWRDGRWEIDNLELDYQLRARPEALLQALEAFSTDHLGPLVLRWRARVGQAPVVITWHQAS
ncbi:hypothetical protein D3C72_918410 [compost metagenome]